MKLFLAYILSVASFIGFGQNNIFPLRFSLEYQPTLDFVSFVRGVSQSSGSYSLSGTPDPYDYREYEDLWFSRNSHTIGHNFLLHVKVARRISIEIPFGTKQYDYRYAAEENDLIYSHEYYDIYDFSFTRKTIGFGVNMHFNKGYSLLGNSIGFFIKSNNFTFTDYNEYYTYLSKTATDKFSEKDKVTYRSNVLGIKYSWMTMVTDLLPIYIKGGASAAVPISSIIIDKNVSSKSFKDYSEQSNQILNDNDIIKRFNSLEYIQLFIGLGIVI